MKDRKYFSEQFKLWRKAEGLKKIEAAKIFGVTPETICHWEAEKHNHKMEICLLFAKN